jgi:hypothetical protein
MSKNKAVETKAVVAKVAKVVVEKKPVFVAPEKSADMAMLKAVCEAIVSREKGSKLSESEMLVASAAMNLDRWGELTTKEKMLADVVERTAFGGYNYRSAAADRSGLFNLYRGVHRDISAHYGCKLGRGTNVLEGEMMETAYNAHNKKASKRSARVKISPVAQKVLSEYAAAIAAKFAK